MKKVTFYFLQHHQKIKNMSAHEALSCTIALENWRSGKRVLIACTNKKQAQHLDQELWNFKFHAFIPHNLSNEGIKIGAPISLCWPGQYNNLLYDVLITLQLQFLEFTTTFNQVIDFVPYERTLKELARNRYRSYRNVGFNLTTAISPI
ncbi:DNA polymerase III subunit chi [Candidatus Ecksteinia adelgidicola]|nr:DNA polymerase III subunit chi [Candidatus Ecksteinia adelgidicola]